MGVIFASGRFGTNRTVDVKCQRVFHGASDFFISESAQLGTQLACVKLSSAEPRGRELQKYIGRPVTHLG